VVGNDGWESAETDIIGIHDYDHAGAIAQRYHSHEDIPTMLREVRLSGRLSTLTGHDPNGQPVVLSEFGGIAFTTGERRDQTWGYRRANSAAELGQQYAELLRAVRDLPFLAGYCYTQFADTYQESNGLLYADRTPKVPLDQIAAATTGTPAQ
jgi:hypothetical protein